MKALGPRSWAGSPPCPAAVLPAHSSWCSAQPSPAQEGPTPPKISFSWAGMRGGLETRGSIFTGKPDDRHRSPEILQSFPWHFLLTREGNTRNLISEPIWANFFHTQYSYSSRFSPNLWVLIQTFQPPGPLGVYLSLNIVDLQKARILFLEQTLLSWISSDTEPFPN